MPMWLWATPLPSSFGPVSASASAGAVTVTAKVTSVRWTMGDGTTITCHGPGTPYKPRYGKRDSPTCGHRYSQPAEYEGTATSTWTVQWEAPALGDSGTLTETRTTPFTAWVGEAQALGTG
ncbi:ATP/GTP-binding protein [Streptomyces roseolus]|uniref:ATP/GTP-binding protein n=1 Tax=Streptomyces roseolus TaxID=67358 RepID=UPI0036FB8EED